MRLLGLLAVLAGCIYESGGERVGGTGGSGGIAPGIDAAPNTGCNFRTGMGCVCGTTPCPQPTDMCVQLSGSSGPFCSNQCTQQDQAATCALDPGQPGQGVCALILNPGDAGSSTPDHCIVVCNPSGNCPAGMVPQTIQATCVCVGP